MSYRLNLCWMEKKDYNELKTISKQDIDNLDLFSIKMNSMEELHDLVLRDEIISNCHKFFDNLSNYIVSDYHLFVVDKEALKSIIKGYHREAKEMFEDIYNCTHEGCKAARMERFLASRVLQWDCDVSAPYLLQDGERFCHSESIDYNVLQMVHFHNSFDFENRVMFVFGF